MKPTGKKVKEEEINFICPGKNKQQSETEKTKRKNYRKDKKNVPTHWITGNRSRVCCIFSGDRYNKGRVKGRLVEG